METMRLEEEESPTYSGEEGASRDHVTHAAWAQDFFAGGPPSKERILFDLKSLLTVDNLIALAILRRDPAMGQCVSYYRLTLDFRNDQGFLGSGKSKFRIACTHECRCTREQRPSRF
jgi:hypothetical protein